MSLEISAQAGGARQHDPGAPERQPWGGSLMHVADSGGNVASFIEGRAVTGPPRGLEHN